MASIITIAGEKLFAAKAQANEQLDIDTFIFANVPGQDATAPISREEGLPSDYIVHQQIVQQVGRINDNVVVYSTVLDSVTGPFEFNWVGLYSSVNNTLVAINHIPTTPKTVTADGVAGNTLNRNFGIEYSGIADLTGIDVAPETWQLDFTARLSGMDKLTKQLATDINGKNWFVDDGFKVLPRNTVDTFSINKGIGYVGGLRVELENEHVVTCSQYPCYIYVDAWFDGDASSQWSPSFAITVTTLDMDDYVDQNGKEHTVFKLALVESTDQVQDLRTNLGIQQKVKQHLEDKEQAHEAKAIKTENGLNLENGTRRTVPNVEFMKSMPVYNVGAIVEVEEYYEGTNAGAGKWRVILANEANNFQTKVIISSFDNTFAFILVSKWDASAFGTIGAPSPADTHTALQLFFNCIGVGGYGEIEDATYVVNDTISIEEKVNAHIKFKGDVEIKSNNKNKEVIRISGRVLNTSGIPEFGYLDSIELTKNDVNAIGVLYTGLARSKIAGWRIRHTALPEKINTETGFGYPNGQNALFSVTFNLKDLSDFCIAAFDYRAFKGGNTGNFIANFYMSNFVNGEIKECDRFGWIGTTSEWAFGQVNFERAKCKHLVAFNSDVDSIAAQAIHIEEVIPVENYDGFFRFNDNTTFDVQTITTVGLKMDDQFITDYSMFKFGNDVNINVGSLKERDTTVLGVINLRVNNYAGSGEESLVNINSSKLSEFENLEFGTPRGLKPTLFIPRVYPLEGVTRSNDSSIIWHPHKSPKEVVFVGTSATRKLTVNTEREFAGMSVFVTNTSEIHDVEVVADEYLGIVPPGESKKLLFDGVYYYLS